MMKRKFGLIIFVTIMAMLPNSVTYANGVRCVNTKIKNTIEAVGQYKNWDGVSNVSQFVDNKGNFNFAYDDGKYICVRKMKGAKLSSDVIKLKKKSNIFGAVTVDSKGYYYVATGKENKGNDTSKNTVFITKYDKKGKNIKSVGDNGGSSLEDYYDKSFYTKVPFYAGTCDIAVNDDYVAINYARLMYNGHQSNSLFLVKKNSMEKINAAGYYNSHSFAQRIISDGNSFIFASEGDCFPRAFTISTVNTKDLSSVINNDIFHFWVKKGTYSAWDMFTLNDNFAHMGGLAKGRDNKIAFSSSSVKSLNSKAAKETEQIFIQIFEAGKDLTKAASYVTKGKRTGVSGPDGTDKANDYGVKWLTNFGKKYSIENPQIVSTKSGKYVVLFERSKGYKCEGVFSIVVDAKGNIVKKAANISKKARLNPCRMPVYADGAVYWAGNREGVGKNEINVYSLKIK